MIRWRNVQKRADFLKEVLSPGTVIAAFDTETTGLDEKAKIIQFSGVHLIYQNGQFEEIPGSDIDIYINPEEKLSEEITKITGITQDMVSTCQNERYYFMTIMLWLDRAQALCAYNAGFDCRMIDQMCKRLNQPLLGRRPVIDVLEWTRDLIPRDEVNNYTLKKCAEYLCDADEVFRFHSSSEDVKAMVSCMNHLIDQYRSVSREKPGRPLHLERAGLFINPHRQRQGRIRLTLNFGKTGDIFYDIYEHCWSCKSSTSARKLFDEADKSDLERQFLNRYAYPFGLSTPDEVADSWLKYWESKHPTETPEKKEKSNKAKKQKQN